jgi:hypothetical protein
MSVSQDRFEFALTKVGTGDWERFEKLASTFLASEWAGLRTVASPNGDGGRDSELFQPNENPTVYIQYSVQKGWQKKIRDTIRRLDPKPGQSTVLVFMSNQTIGANADAIKAEALAKNVFLDVRDIRWFVERVNADTSKAAAAEALCRAVVDPLLDFRSLADRSALAIEGQEAKTALIFLEMQWRDQSAGKGLTKSSFDALVRAALHNTDTDHRVSREVVYQRVSKFLSQHSRAELIPHIDAALLRLNKTVVKHRKKEDEFCLSHQEIERLKNVAASVQLLYGAFEVDATEVISSYANFSQSETRDLLEGCRRVVEKCFLRRGEEFVSALTSENGLALSSDALKSIIIEVAPRRQIGGLNSVEVLTSICGTLLSTPSERTLQYLQLLSETYTLFAFLEAVPDVQKVTKKLFSSGEIWLDTSAILPLIAEEASPEGLKPFTVMTKKAATAGLKLRVTKGILQEIERHLNRCLAYARTAKWEGRTPYVYARYELSGKPRAAFASWVERFCGRHRPEDDIADYLYEEYGIEVLVPARFEFVREDVEKAIRAYWHDVHEQRRGDEDLNHAYRLAEHDAETCLLVIEERLKSNKSSPLGYTSWWLTFDRAARHMMENLDKEVKKKVKHSPVISADFLLRYIAFGPRRDRAMETSQGLSQFFAESLFEFVPNELITVAQTVRSECGELPERIIRRRIRDSLDKARLEAGGVQAAGLDRALDAIQAMF